MQLSNIRAKAVEFHMNTVELQRSYAYLHIDYSSVTPQIGSGMQVSIKRGARYTIQRLSKTLNWLIGRQTVKLLQRWSNGGTPAWVSSPL